MLSSAFITLALATAAFSHPTKRQTGGVITSCTVPNTAALTFDDGPYIYSYVSDPMYIVLLTYGGL